jgi:hypothetical protein
LADSSADQHASGEDGLRAGAIVSGIAAGNHRLRGGSVGGFADADECPREQEHREGVNMTGEDGREAPEDDAAGDDARAIEAVGEKSERNAGERENGLQRDLEITDLRAGESELVANERNERGNCLAVSEVHQVDEREDRKQAHLIRRQLDARKRHVQ